MAGQSHDPADDQLSLLQKLLGTDLVKRLEEALNGGHNSIKLKVTIEPGSSPSASTRSNRQDIEVGSLDIERSNVERYLKNANFPSHGTSASDRGGEVTIPDALTPPDSNVPSPLGYCIASKTLPQEEEFQCSKRRKKAGGMQVITTGEVLLSTGMSTPRQLHLKSKEFPQRKKILEDRAHQIQPSSTEKLVSGIWKQLYSSVIVTSTSMIITDQLCFDGMRNGADRESFRAINSLCLNVTKAAKCSKALEYIVQAYWVDLFEMRIKTIATEKPFLSDAEARMSVLQEACAVLKWSEKELRNKLAIWRGYKEIKDAGGWVSLVFAGSGIYRFCKYRTGFSKNLFSTLGRLQSSFEVAADTIHPSWRQLLQIIGIESSRQYVGHPHDWVVCDTASPETLASTYNRWFPDFHFTHVEQSTLDKRAWSSGDPRRITYSSSAICHCCGYVQSNNVAVNECRCFPELYGCNRSPCPVQVFRTGVGKNNGLVARCDFARGQAIGEFVGLITKGLDGKDVMQSGAGDKQYQIF